MSGSLVTPITRRSSVVVATFRILLVVACLLAISAVMSPRPAMAEETHHQYKVRLEVYRSGETAYKWADWLSPSARWDFTDEELWWHIYSVIGTDDPYGIIEANGLAGQHPADGAQENIQLADGKGRVRYTSTVIGTLKISDSEHGTGSVVGSIGPTGEVTTVTPNVFAERICLSATPDEGYAFDRWEILCDDFGLYFDNLRDPNTCLNVGVTIRDIDICPTFKALPTQPVTVTDDGHGTGSSSMTDAWNGAKVTLSATPSDGWEFDRWVVVRPDGLVIDGDSFVMGGDPVTVQATFKEATKPVPAGGSTGEDRTPGEGDAATEPATGEPTGAPARGTEGVEPKGRDGTMELPATGDAVVPVAVGILVVAGVAIAVIMHRRS